MPQVAMCVACAERGNERTRWIACAAMAPPCCWRVRARHAVPLLRKRRQNDVGLRAKHCELWRVLTLAQAGMPVLLKGKFKGAGRRPAVRKAKAKRTMSRSAPSIAITLRFCVGTGRNACATERPCCPRTGVVFTCRLLADACATERRASKRNAACYDFGLVARYLLAILKRNFVAQPVRMLANPSDGP